MHHGSSATYVGIVGPSGSGKDTVANYLVEKHGFEHISTGDLIRQYVKAHNLGGLDRRNLQKVATEIRESVGGAYWMLKALASSANRLVVSGIRTEAEAEALRKKGGIIIALDAPVQVRFERSFERGGETDGVTFEGFKELDDFELHNDNPEAQNVLAVRNLADYVIDNGGSLKKLERAVDEVVQKFL